MARGLILTLTFVIFGFVQVQCQIGEGLSPNDKQYFQSLAENILSDGTKSTPGRIYSATKLLKMMGIEIREKIQICSLSEKNLREAEENVKSAYYALSTFNALGCSSSPALSQSTKSAMLSSLNDDSLQKLQYPVLLDLENSGGENLDTSSIVSFLADLQDKTSGIFSDTVEEQPSLKSTSTALNLIENLLPVAQNEELSYLKQMASTASKLLPSSLDDDLADASLVHSLIAVNGNLKLKAKQQRVIITDLVSMKYTSCICTALKIYKSFVAVSKLSKPPLVLSLNEPAVSFESSGLVIEITLLDVLGNALDSGYEVAVTNFSSDEGISLEERKTFSSVGKGIYTLSIKLDPAAYLLDMEVVSGSGEKVKFRKRMVVNIPVSATDITCTISNSKHAVEGEEYENRLPLGSEASAFEGHWLHLSFDVVDSQSQLFTPHQAFVRLSHMDSGLDTYFIATPNARGRLTGAISLADESSTLLYRSGMYSVSILIGDTVISEAKEVDLGQINLSIIPEKKTQLPLYKQTLLHDSDTTLEALPEKFHTFREPDQRAHTFVSLVFTASIVGTLLILVGGITKAGGNIKNLTTLPGTAFVWAAGFQICIGAILFLFVTYWLDLTMITCLTYLTPLALGTLFVGHRALCNLASLREGSEKK